MKPTTLHSHLMSDFFPLTFTHCYIFTLKLILLYIYFYHLFHFALPYLSTYESSRLLAHFHLTTTLSLWGILYIFLYPSNLENKRVMFFFCQN